MQSLRLRHEESILKNSRVAPKGGRAQRARASRALFFQQVAAEDCRRYGAALEDIDVGPQAPAPVPKIQSSIEGMYRIGKKFDAELVDDAYTSLEAISAGLRSST